jgi:hypothetical protein
MAVSCGMPDGYGGKALPVTHVVTVYTCYRGHANDRGQWADAACSSSRGQKAVKYKT